LAVNQESSIEKSGTSVEQLIQEAIDKNPEISLVLEIAARARELELKEPPRNIGIATETAAIPTNLQYPVSQATLG